MHRLLTVWGEGATLFSFVIGCFIAVSFLHQQPEWMVALINLYRPGENTPFLYDHWRAVVVGVSCILAAIGLPALTRETLRHLPGFSKPVQAK